MKGGNELADPVAFATWTEPNSAANHRSPGTGTARQTEDKSTGEGGRPLVTQKYRDALAWA